MLGFNNSNNVNSFVAVGNDDGELARSAISTLQARGNGNRKRGTRAVAAEEYTHLASSLTSSLYA